MKQSIIITSIFPPTEAIIDFSQKQDYELIVVGDKKSPAQWSCNNVEYFSVEDQEKMNFSLNKVLPYNHYCRKMLGYLVAIKNGSTLIIDTDDDNIPKENWGFPSMQGNFDCIEKDLGFTNIYQYYTEQKIWPRGLPLNLINKFFDFNNNVSKKECKIGVWQGLADEDPDVDAIYRLTSDQICHFNEREPIVLGKGTVSPFNTQNTIIARELFPLLYLPTCVTFRFTDILRGLVAQPIMWLYDYHLGFINATVVQKRNPHDYFNDFISEIPMYKHCEEVIDVVSGSINANSNINDNLFNAYHSLSKKGIVPENELPILEAWLSDIVSIVK